jgi:hypothetical protein
MNHNATNYLAQMTVFYYFNRPTNLAFHDLTSRLSPPKNLRSLLGLGLKFIPTPHQSTLASTLYSKEGAFPRLSRSIELRCFFIDSDHLDPSEPSVNYNPRMYINSDWSPPFSNVPRALSQRLHHFEQTVTSEFRTKLKVKPNLLRHQRFALEHLRQQNDFLIVACDKNLGPSIIERDEYIKLAFRDHLSDPNTYQYLPPAEVATKKHLLEGLLSAWMIKHYKILSREERKFLQRHSSECIDPFPYFYLTMKVHKTPLKTRPIVSCSGSLLFALGIWIDDKLQPVARAQQSYFKSSYVLKQQLLALHLPPNAKLFTSDAVSMYTSIPTAPALREIARYLRRNRALFPDVPVKALVDALTLVMKNNVVQFGDTHWLQLSGAAMGTPPAPPYATLFYAIFEDTLIEEFGANLFYYRRFIDDILGIWVPCQDPADDTLAWNRFKARLSDFHSLIWETEERSSSTIFMDLTITIHDSRISTSLYSKPLNLYLYLPPQSSHPPGVLSGLISGMIFRIYTLCSDPIDVRVRLQDFWNRLLARGYTAVNITTLFSKGIDNARNYIDPTIPATVNEHIPNLFLHLRYHPQDPSPQVLQQAWKDTMALPHNSRALATIPVRSRDSGKNEPFGIDRLIISYHRPSNLGNLLSYRKLAATTGPPVSSFRITDM